jgi:GNAT superfamily N-acetyltransferase
MDSTFRTERRPPDDPVVEEMLARYMDELRVVMPGFDPERASPPAPGDFAWPDGAFLVVFEAGRAVGCGALRRLEAGTGELRRMWVRPAWRGRGVGRYLLESLEALALEMGLSELRLDTNHRLERAQALY